MRMQMRNHLIYHVHLFVQDSVNIVPDKGPGKLSIYKSYKFNACNFTVNTEAITIVTTTRSVQKGRINEKSKFCLTSSAFITENNHRSYL